MADAASPRIGDDAPEPRRLRALRSAPWFEAAPLAIGVATALVLAFVVLDQGGWGQYFRSDPYSGWTMYVGEEPPRPIDEFVTDWGAKLTVYGLPLVALAAAFRRFCIAGALSAAGALLIVGVWNGGLTTLFVDDELASTGGVFGYADVQLGVTRRPDSWDVYHSTGIEIVGVVGVLMATAALTSFIAAFAQHRRGGRERRPLKARLLPAALWLLAVLVLPRLTVLASRAIEPALGLDPADDDTSWFPLVLLFTAFVAIYGAALALPRRRPVLATAALIVGLGLLIPAFWSVGGLLTSYLELLWSGFEAGLWIWGVMIVATILIVRSVTRRAALGRLHPE